MVVGEPLAELASVTDVALTIRKGRKVRGVYGYVTAKIRVLLAQASCECIEAGVYRGTVLVELHGETVGGPHTRRPA
jgi:hypothetical protein